jgi:hypothetical protein
MNLKQGQRKEEEEKRERERERDRKKERKRKSVRRCSSHISAMSIRSGNLGCGRQ